ncbi:MAG: DHH family phosphoesterase, partial [Anaerolineales bacterium]
RERQRSMDSELLKQAAQRFADADRILVTSHVRPDGDAVSSVLALGLALKERGKDVQIVLVDGVSADGKHLPGADQVVRRAKPPVDLVVSLDAADRERTGESLREFPTVDINIDHHITNTRFAAINLVDPAAVSTTAMLADYFPAFGLDFSPAVVDAMLNGMLTDTIGFRTSNMNAKALRIAADLVEKGADLSALYERALLRRSFAAMRYWGMGLSKLQRDGDLIWTSLTLADRVTAGYPNNDDAELVNNLSAVEGALITILFVEQADKQVKISWRSQGGRDVSQLAAQFGGGGHEAAAGAVLNGTLEVVQQKVLRSALSYLQAVPA